MVENGSRDTAPTRRGYLGGTAAILGGGLLAGCLGDDGDDSESSGNADGSTSGDDGADSGEPNSTNGEGSGDDGSRDDGSDGDESDDGSSGHYSVSMPPVGEVEFDEVPEVWVANNGSWADMGIALGQEPPEAVWLSNRYRTQYYDEIPGVEVDGSAIDSLYQDGIDKERFYGYDADVHVMDPNFLLNRYSGWEQSDVDDIENRVAPLFGNSIFSTGYEWHQDYPYLSLYEAFEKLAELFQERERYAAFVSVHEAFQSNLDEVTPAEGERRQVAVMWGSGDEPTSFSPYLVGEGTGFKHLRELDVRDAFAETDVRDFHSTRGEVDFEALLDIDPEVILLRGQEAKTAEEFQDTVVSFFEDNNTASHLTAVENGDVYRAGGLYQGPITNMVLTERLASDLYGADEELFDRERVADIVNGEF